MSVKIIGLLLFLSSAEALAERLTIQVDVWADNWFAFYLGEQPIKEDSVAITTERSFNKETFSFKAELPLQINMIVKDFKENDTGLEYIGTGRQQMGDGGFIVQLRDQQTGDVIAVSNNQWRCLVIHKAPLNKRCENSIAPSDDCQSEIIAEPKQWLTQDFDDSAWPKAVEYSERAVRPKGGYDLVDWVADAQLIWSSDLEADNTLLCRFTVNERF